VGSLIIARKKLVGQRVTLGNQIRGLAVVFGVRLPRALSPTFIRHALQASEGSPACLLPCEVWLRRGRPSSPPSWRIDGDIRRMARASGPCPSVDEYLGVGQLTSLALPLQLTIPNASGALVTRGFAIIMHAILRHGTEFKSALPSSTQPDRRSNQAPERS